MTVRWRWPTLLVALALVASPGFGNVTVTVVYATPGDGFDSVAAPDPVSTAPGATLGDQRKASFEAAAAFWSFKLTSNVAIIVEAQMVPLTCNAGSAVLGSAGATSFVRDWPGVPLPGTWYHFGLANKLFNADLFPASSDVQASFNSDIDNNNSCLNGINWFYAIGPGPGPAGTISFFDVVLHEIGHGVGVSSLVNLNTGARALNFNDIYMTFLEDHNLGGGTLWPAMSNGQRQASAIDSPNTHWIGPAVQAKVNTGFLSGGVNNTHARVYAPNPVQGGSSISHWDTTVEDMLGTSEIMEPFAVPGSDFLLTDELLEDIGWGPVATVPVTLASFLASQEKDGVRFRWSTATEVGNAGFNLFVDSEEGWQRINPRLVGSHRGDSVDAREYEYFAAGLTGTRFAIEDVDINSRTRRHQAFEVGDEYGRQATSQPIDWTAIRAVKDAKVAARSQANRAVPASRTAVELRLDTEGIYRVTHEELLASGFDGSGIPKGALALSSQGRSVPIYVDGPGARFGPGSYLEFYGEGLDTLYTKTNVYTLSVAGRHARRMALDRTPPPLGASPEPFYLEPYQVEEQRTYSFSSPNGDPWFDTPVLAYQDEPASATFDLVIDRLHPGEAARLEVGMWGVTDFPEGPDHHVTVALNGVVLADLVFDGLVDVPLSLVLPPGLLAEGSNDLVVTLPGDTGQAFDLVHLDRYGATYPRDFAMRQGQLVFEAAGGYFEVDGLESSDVVAYRIGDRGPTRLLGVTVDEVAAGQFVARLAGSDESARYFVLETGAIRSPKISLAGRSAPDLKSGSGQYLIISHPDFLTGLEPLVDARRSEGYSVKVVDVEDIYRQLAHGVLDPQAIADYIAFAAEELGTEIVLLVGGDSYDYLDYLGLGSISFLPTLYTQVNPVVLFSPSDPLFADIDGDEVPDLALGRLPVRTEAELAAIIDKTLEYPTAGHGSTAVFAADDVEPGVSFRDISEANIDQLPVHWSVDRAYIDDLGGAGARDQLLDSLNRGVALSHFFGHSGPVMWTFDGLFHVDDAAELTNQGRPTVAVQWGCWNSYYVAATHETLAHGLLLSDDRGAAAVLGAATLTQVSSDKLLGGLLLPRLTEPGMSLGQALLDAKRELARTRPDLRDVLLGWTLLGDPTLVLEP